MSPGNAAVQGTAVGSWSGMATSTFGLCDTCMHQRRVRSGRGSVFSMCRIGLRDPDWPKYPPMPVRACGRYERREAPPGGSARPS
jgi:hypothetical protein